MTHHIEHTMSDSLYFEITLGVLPSYKVEYNKWTWAFTMLKRNIALYLAKQKAIQSIFEINKQKNKILPVRIHEAVIPYQHDDVLLCEPVLVISGELNPRYYCKDEGKNNWKELVAAYAVELGKRFDQSRVYLSFKNSDLSIIKIHD